MFYRCARTISIDAAHRVPHHASKCQHLHGHRYEIWAEVKAAGLAQAGEQQGMVIDFGFLKEEMMEAIDKPCDHATILWEKDILLNPTTIHVFGKLCVIPYVPTAENLARYWFDLLAPRVSLRTEGRAFLEALTVFETPNCSATYPAS